MGKNTRRMSKNVARNMRGENCSEAPCNPDDVNETVDLIVPDEADTACEEIEMTPAADTEDAVAVHDPYAEVDATTCLTSDAHNNDDCQTADNNLSTTEPGAECELSSPEPGKGGLSTTEPAIGELSSTEGTECEENCDVEEVYEIPPDTLISTHTNKPAVTACEIEQLNRRQLIFWCDICSHQMVGVTGVYQHFNSKNHRARVEGKVTGNLDKTLHATDLNCTVCRQKFTDASSALRHFRGNQHALRKHAHDSRVEQPPPEVIKKRRTEHYNNGRAPKPLFSPNIQSLGRTILAQALLQNTVQFQGNNNRAQALFQNRSQFQGTNTNLLSQCFQQQQQQQQQQQHQQQQQQHQQQQQQQRQQQQRQRQQQPSSQCFQQQPSLVVSRKLVNCEDCDIGFDTYPEAMIHFKGRQHAETMARTVHPAHNIRGNASRNQLQPLDYRR